MTSANALSTVTATLARVTGATDRTRAARFIISLAIAAGLLFAPSSHASLRWVGDDYYGINFQQLRALGDHARAEHVRRIAKLGIREVRLGVAWPRVEPKAPVNGSHDYRWGAIDGEIGALARRGISAQLNITQTPSWDARTGAFANLQCPPRKASSRAPVSIQPYVELTRAIAARYGRGGTFWRTHADLPEVPVASYEIWNEPNLRGGWCPEPQPAVYADMFVGAARDPLGGPSRAGSDRGHRASHRRRSQARHGPRFLLRPGDPRQPQLPHVADGVAVHIYTPPEAEKMLDGLASFRDELTRGGLPRSLPMLINEIGWPTKGGVRTGLLNLSMDSAPIVPEQRRAKAYRALAVNIPRSNCNVMGVTPQAWTSREEDPTNSEDWFGIANPNTTKPYPSARAYSKSLRMMRGERHKQPPRGALKVCSGIPLPRPQDDPTAAVAIKDSRSKHPRMRFKARAGGSPVRKAKLKLPHRLRFANGNAWRKGIKARAGSRKLRKSAVHHTKRKLTVKLGPKGAERVRVKVRRKALRRIKPIRHRRLRFRVVIRDLDHQRTPLKLEVRARRS